MFNWNDVSFTKNEKHTNLDFFQCYKNNEHNITKTSTSEMVKQNDREFWKASFGATLVK